MDIPTRYDFQATEKRIYALWRERNCFDSAYDQDGALSDGQSPDKPTFVVAIPPPNVTGRLHMGHALNNTIQDVLVRYKRMDGYDALWLPGTDHAGISTQTVVRKHLDAEGVDYRELGREKFIEKVWEWKKTYGDFILTQLERLGSSCDWRRTTFTMDEGPSRGVRTVFKALYDRGLLYRGKRIVNWCPVDRTALSDDEVSTKDGGEPRPPLAHPLPARGAGGRAHASDRRDHATGDALRRRGGRRAPRGRALPGHRRQDARASPAGPPHPRRGRRLRRPRVRNGLPQDHARARRERLRGRQAARTRARQRHARRRVDERRGARGLSWPRPLRGAQTGRRGAGRAGSARPGRGPHGAGRARPALRRGDRVPPLRSVVRPHGAACGEGPRGQRLPAHRRRMGKGRRQRAVLPPSALGEDLLRVALEHPRLDDQPADLVGAPHPRLVPQGDRRDRGRHRHARGGSGEPGRLGAGRRRARHLVPARGCGP